MSDKPNPFDLGPAADPVDPSAFNAAKDAWYADRDRIIKDVLPQVDKAITAIDDWSNAAQSAAALIGELVPILQSFSTAAVLPPSVNPAEVTNVKAILAGIRERLACLGGNCA